MNYLSFAMLIGVFGLTVCNGMTWHHGTVCPTVTTMPNFNATRYLGIWYQAAAARPSSMQDECVRNTYGLNENGTTSILYAVGRGESYKPECGHAFQRSSNSSKGIWSVYLSGHVSDYFILSNGTDYDYYSAVYYCKETDVGPIEEDGLILTRYKHPSFSQIQFAQDAFTQQGLDFNFQPTPQLDNCTYQNKDGTQMHCTNH